MLPEDIGRIVEVSDPAVRPDGTVVAVVVTTTDVESNRYPSALWLVPAGGGRARALTSGHHVDASPRWSPAGDRLAFTREVRDAAPTERWQLVVAELGEDGELRGELRPVASSPEAITSPAWSADGEHLAWVTRIDRSGVAPGSPDRDRPARRIDRLCSRLDDVGWIIDRPAQVVVGRADAVTPPRVVTAGAMDHAAPAWSPDGRLVLTGSYGEDADLHERTDLWLVDPFGPADPPTGVPALVGLTSGPRSWSLPSWSPDGRSIAALATDSSAGYQPSKVVVLPVDPATGAAGAPVDTAPTVDRTFAPTCGTRPAAWLDGTTLLGQLESDGRVSLVRLRADGAAPPAELAGGDRWVLQYDAAGATLALVTSGVHPAELSVVALDGDGTAAGPEIERTSFTAAFRERCPAVAGQRFAVPSPAGDGALDCWLHPPAGEVPQPWPLLVSVHGGPMTQYGDHWFDEFQLWTRAGFAVACTNPHGSSGKSTAFGRALRSPLAAVHPGTGWGGVDADDVLALLDATLVRFPVDPARVGLLGGSYGGYLTTWLLARTDRFAAGCSERAVNNLLSEEWSSDFGGHFRHELGVSHLEHPEEYLRMSPVTYVEGLTAPLLILHSEQDLRCHIEQADALFVAMRLLGRTPEYWRFPGESHELSRSGNPRHRIQRAELIIDFFRRHLAAP